MILCLTCHRLWPAGSKFCGHCAGSFGGRFCGKGHRNPVAARACIDCASTELSRPTASLSVRPMTVLAALVVALLLFKLIVLNAGTLLTWTGGLGDWLLAVTLGTGLQGFVAWLIRSALLLSLPFLFWWIVLERCRRPSASLTAYRELLKWLGRTGFRSTCTLYRWLAASSQQRQSKNPPPTNK